MKVLLINLYRKYLKRYIFFRKLRNIYFKGKNLISKILNYYYLKKILLLIFQQKKYKKYIFLSYSDFLRISKTKNKLIENEYKYSIKLFKSFPRFYQKKYIMNFDNLNYPEIFSFTIKDCIAINNSSFIIKDDYCLHNDLIDFEVEDVWELSSGYLKLKDNKICINLPNKTKKIQNGIFLVNPLNANYSHFILETLLKLSALNLSEYTEYSIIIDNNLHKNIYKLLSLYTNNSIKIYKIKPNEKIIINNCLIISPTAHIVFNHKNLASSNLKFSDSYYNLNLIKRLSLELIVNSKKSKKKLENAEKIFLMRNQNYNKKILNYLEVLDYFNQNGYKLIDPEEIDITDLILLLNNAKIIISQAGSALTNLIFASDNTKIFALAGWAGKNGNCHFFYNSIYQDNLQLNYIIFKADVSFKCPIHKNFFVDLNYLNSILKKENGL
jgi:hypothetical protein